MDVLEKPPMNKLVDKPATADRLLRIDDVLALTNIGKSSWWAGVKSGKFPKPIKLGERTTRWRLNDILELTRHGVSDV
jgi:predicted DNA-binding transcriptional regulator AlpA